MSAREVRYFTCYIVCLWNKRDVMITVSWSLYTLMVHYLATEQSRIVQPVVVSLMIKMRNLSLILRKRRNLSERFSVRTTREHLINPNKALPAASIIEREKLIVFISLTLWPYWLDSGPAMEIHSNSLSRRNVSIMTSCVSHAEQSDWSMKDVKNTCEHTSLRETDLTVNHKITRNNTSSKQSILTGLRLPLSFK